jgi:hypothetical protein
MVDVALEHACQQTLPPPTMMGLLRGLCPLTVKPWGRRPSPTRSGRSCRPAGVCVRQKRLEVNSVVDPGKSCPSRPEYRKRHWVPEGSCIPQDLARGIRSGDDRSSLKLAPSMGGLCWTQMPTAKRDFPTTYHDIIYSAVCLWQTSGVLSGVCWVPYMARVGCPMRCESFAACNTAPGAHHLAGDGFVRCVLRARACLKGVGRWDGSETYPVASLRGDGVMRRHE